MTKVLLTCVILTYAWAGQTATHTVVIEGMKFTPSTITVKSGDSITWVNKDFFPHTVTALKNFNSRSIPADKSWTYKASAKGKFPYKCLFHPTMKAELVVE
jgi:plastocyanin